MKTLLLKCFFGAIVIFSTTSLFSKNSNDSLKHPVVTNRMFQVESSLIFQTLKVNWFPNKIKRYYFYAEYTAFFNFQLKKLKFTKAEPTFFSLGGALFLLPLSRRKVPKFQTEGVWLSFISLRNFDRKEEYFISENGFTIVSEPFDILFGTGLLFEKRLFFNLLFRYESHFTLTRAVVSHRISLTPRFHSLGLTWQFPNKLKS